MPALSSPLSDNTCLIFPQTDSNILHSYLDKSFKSYPVVERQCYNDKVAITS